uniref:CENPB protein Homeodomainlike putative n=1 Tax=Albugo laibachii Nc14 TaxID=890382 RepID=F0WY62_9STRA|nr:CENPB protein Homeodomainlike putative [Albugo laibachii Nc14]|eukprot:CCA26413.1 CENPB protein Homeodomainlike putative [Albugo laibachii Nc14]
MPLSRSSSLRRAMREVNLVKAPFNGIISGIVRDRKIYLLVKEADLKCKRTWPLDFPAVDKELANWMLQCQSKRVMLSEDLIKAKAKWFATLSVPETPWLQAYEHTRREWLGDTGVIPAQRDAIRERLKGLTCTTWMKRDSFYCLAPDKIIARRQVKRSKKSKTRVTVSLTCNADGAYKREPFIIGHANKPRCFQKKSGDQLGLNYRSNIKAWMTGVLFQEWLQEFDDDMCSQRRNVVLILDNASAHTVYGMELQSVTVMLLPLNTT